MEDIDVEIRAEILGNLNNTASYPFEQLLFKLRQGYMLTATESKRLASDIDKLITNYNELQVKYNKLHLVSARAVGINEKIGKIGKIE